MTFKKNSFVYILLLLYIGVIFFSSCKKNIGDFLDKAPGVDVTEDTIFSSQREIETLVATLYRIGLPTCLPLHDDKVSTEGYFQTSSGASDEGDNAASWAEPHNWNNATVNVTNIPYVDGRYQSRWKAIRIANTLIQRIAAGKANADPAYLKQVTGQAKFIRAYDYFEMLKRYGGEPIVTIPLTAQEVLKTPLHRSSIANMVDFIVKGCDGAAADLPDSYPSNMRGKATKGAALMLKSRALLFAASPLFNTGSPYLDFGNYDTLICYGNYNKDRWQKAADAAKAVIDWAPSGNIRLITDKGVDNNYEYVWETPDNSEIILANKTHGPQNQWGYPWYGILPSSVYHGYGGITVTFNFQQLYEKKDGSPQTWNMDGGDNLNEMYAELDPRFDQTIAYNGSFWNSEYPNIQIYQGGAQSKDCFGGAWQRKFIPRGLVAAYGHKVMPNNILMRLAEAYLNYAEALNEAQGPVPEAYHAVNIIRERSGMPDLPPGLSQDQFRKRVRNERAIELAFEDHRFWDLRRWLTAEKVIGGKMWGLKIYKISGSKDFRYEPYVFQTRSFLPKMYLNPFYFEEVDKGYLVQNPGW